MTARPSRLPARMPPTERRSLVRALRALTAGSPRLRRALLDSLIEASVDDLAAVQAACDARDWEALRGRVHRLKGGACILGYPALTELAGQLEAAAAAGDASAVLALVPRLAGRVESLVAVLRDLRGDACPPSACSGAGAGHVQQN